MKLPIALLAGTMLAGLASAGTAHAGVSGVCPSIGTLQNTGPFTDCNVEITFGPGGAISTTVTHSNPYDPKAGHPNTGSDDALVGIINNSGHSIASLFFSGSTSFGGFFGFDGDGLQTFGASLGNDPTGYGGKTSSGQFVTFTGINGTIQGNGSCSGTCSSGTVVFGASGIANGGTAYFSLEGPPSLNVSPAATPEPGAIALFGAGLLGLAGLRRRKVQ